MISSINGNYVTESKYENLDFDEIMVTHLKMNVKHNQRDKRLHLSGKLENQVECNKLIKIFEEISKQLTWKCGLTQKKNNVNIHY